MFCLSERNKKIVATTVYIFALLLLSSLGFASEGGEHHVDTAAQMKDFGWRVFDFAALVAIVVWAMKKADLKGTLAARQVEIENSLKEAESARGAAEAKLKEYTKKLEQASNEIDTLKAAIVSEGEQERTRIISEARKAAEKIEMQASLSAEQEILKAKSELRAEAIRLAVEVASGKLLTSVNKNDHDRLVGEYLEKVVQIQ